MTHSPPSRRAVVFRPAGSDPASTSVSANEASSSPDASSGRYRLRCASVPNLAMIWPAMPLFVPKSERKAGVVYPNSKAKACRPFFYTLQPLRSAARMLPASRISAAWRSSSLA